MRYYYKTKDGKTYFNLKEPEHDGDKKYVAITEQEFNAHVQELEANRTPMTREQFLALFNKAD